MKMIQNSSANNLDTVFLQMCHIENKQHEIVFLHDVFDHICKKFQYPNYKFAHNLKGEPYMRMRTREGKITVEYIIMKNASAKNYDAYVYQIFKNGNLVYRRPDKPVGTILLNWS